LQPAEAEVAIPTAASAAPKTLIASERALILETLEAVGWLVGGAAGAAAKLGIKRTTLIHKMKKLGISRPQRQDHAPNAEDGVFEPVS